MRLQRVINAYAWPKARSRHHWMQLSTAISVVRARRHRR
jgi:hypothetical protein